MGLLGGLGGVTASRLILIDAGIFHEPISALPGDDLTLPGRSDAPEGSISPEK
jgi:hypothetical protein